MKWSIALSTAALVVGAVVFISVLQEQTETRRTIAGLPNNSNTSPRERTSEADLQLQRLGYNPSARPSSGKVVTVTDKESGKKLPVECDKVFHAYGNPPTITVFPLDPPVLGAILSSWDDLVGRAMSKGDAKASLLLVSVGESMERGNLSLVAQKFLYCECFGEVLHLG
jgi:hypothetical protein